MYHFLADILVAIVFGFVITVKSQSNCSSFLHIPLLEAEGGGSRNCDNCTDESHPCPPWYKPTTDGHCVFGNGVNSVVESVPRTMQTELQYLHCITTSNASKPGREVLGSCLLRFPTYFGETYFTLPCNISELNTFMCGAGNREGQLCGRCKEGFSAPVYSYSLNCVNCTDYSLNWIKYLAIAFGPLTVFSITVTHFHISPASPYLHGLIFAANIISAPNFLRIFVQNLEEFPNKYDSFTQTYMTFLGIWSLDFFRVLYKPFCIHPKLSFLHVIAMDYIIAAYPLFIIVITYFVVSLQYRRKCWFLTKLWKPLRYVLRPVLRNTDVQTSLIDSFATLFLLSTVKFQSVSFDILIPTPLYDIDGHHRRMNLYVAGDVEYFGSQHLPFAIIAIIIMIVFLILPTLLLFLYPCRCFQRILNRFHINFHALRVFMDVFQGPYKDGTNNSRDLRYFAGVFFLLRVPFFTLYSLLEYYTEVMTAGVIFSILLLSTAILQPQKSKLRYCIDSTMLFFFVVSCMIAPGIHNNNKQSITRNIFSALFLAVYFLSIVFLTAIFISWIFTHKVIKWCLIGLVKKIKSLKLPSRSNETNNMQLIFPDQQNNC